VSLTDENGLSFVKNASAHVSLRGNAFITAMQTAELRISMIRCVCEKTRQF